MQPGIYANLSNEEYHAGPGISKSGISLMLESPQKFKSKYIDKVDQETTPAMILGSAVHTAVFEPHLFATEYVVAPKCDKRTKVGKQEYYDFLETVGGRTVLSADDAELAVSISGAVMNHPKAGAIVGYENGLAENSIFSVDDETGLLVKIRPDFLVADRGLIVDLKTTTNSSAGAFSKSCAGFTYHIQAGMYLSVARSQGINVDTFVFIAVEKTPPYAVAVYVADKEMVDLGYEEYRRGLELYKTCSESNNWPGYNDDQITKIGLPVWAARQITER